jgi:hypothetical protein
MPTFPAKIVKNRRKLEKSRKIRKIAENCDYNIDPCPLQDVAVDGAPEVLGRDLPLPVQVPILWNSFPAEKLFGQICCIY